MQPERDHETSFGVFKPTGHTVISFPSAEQAQQGVDAIVHLGVPAGDVRRYSDAEYLAQVEHDLKGASPLAAIGQEMNLALAQKTLAERGYHFLVVKTADDELARQVAEAVQPLGAERAQRYGRFIIEELIEHPDDEPQVAESPDRGLDAQTRSGREEERAELRPADDNAPPPPAR